MRRTANATLRPRFVTVARMMRLPSTVSAFCAYIQFRGFEVVQRTVVAQAVRTPVEILREQVPSIVGQPQADEMHGRKFFGRGFRAVKLHFEEHQLPVVVGRRALQLDIGAPSRGRSGSGRWACWACRWCRPSATLRRRPTRVSRMLWPLRSPTSGRCPKTRVGAPRSTMTHCSPGPPERHEEPVLPSVTDLAACESSFSDDEATGFLTPCEVAVFGERQRHHLDSRIGQRRQGGPAARSASPRCRPYCRPPPWHAGRCRPRRWR